MAFNGSTRFLRTVEISKYMGVRIIRKLTLVFLLLLALPWLVGAVVQPDPSGRVRIRPGQEVTGDGFAVGGSVVNQGSVKGDLFLAGGEVLNDGRVAGDLLAAGGNLSFSGIVDQDARVAGGNVHLAGEVGRNLSVVSGTLQMAPSARVGGNLVAGAGEVWLDGQVMGKALVGAGRLTLAGSIAGDLEAGVQELEIFPGARIGGNLVYSSPQEAKIPAGMVEGQVKWTKLPVSQEEKSWWRIFLGARVVGTLGLLLVALILAGLFPAFWPQAANKLSDQPWSAVGCGLAVLVLIPVIAVILMVTMVGLPVALIFLFLYLPLIYIARLVVGYWLGRRLVHRLPVPWALLLGTLVLVVLSWLPRIGWLVSLTATLWGLGAAWLLFLDYRRQGRVGT